VKKLAALTAILSMTFPTAHILAQNIAAVDGSGSISSTRSPRDQAVKPNLDWSQISKLPPGTVIVIGWTGSRFTKLDFLSASDDALTGLDLSDDTLPAQVVKQLRTTARFHPNYLLRPLPPGTMLVFDNDFYLNKFEIFYGGRKVADVRQIVRTIPRVDMERDAVTLTILPIPKRMPAAAKLCIGVAVAIAALGLIVSKMVPET
jgi:hypothetical protein